MKIALRALGRTDEVLYLTDDMAIGPIAPTRDRMVWAANELQIVLDPERGTRIDQLWNRLDSMRTPITIWMSRFSASEYCGLLAVVSVAKQAPIGIVDVAEVELTNRAGVLFGRSHSGWYTIVRSSRSGCPIARCCWRRMTWPGIARSGNV